MSLIYNALNKLEKKMENGTPNMLGNLGADQYVLNSKSSGMPAWVKILLVLCLLGVVSGWLAMTVLRDQVQALQDGLKSRSASVPLPQPVSVAPTQASVGAINSPVAIAAGDSEKNTVSATEQNTKQTELENGQSLAITDTKLGVEKSELKSSNAEKSVKNLQDLAVSDTSDAAVSAIPESEISHVEIRLESPNATLTVPASKSGKLMPEKKSARQDNSGFIKSEKIAKVDKQAAPRNAVRSESMSGQEISQLTQSIKSAISAGKKAEADDMIAQLEKRLEPESLTLLHVKAWRQMQGGDPQQAIALYQQIVERNPEDETAAINLSLSLWRSGQQVEARRVINAIAERKPDSEIVQSYSRQFGVQK